MAAPGPRRQRRRPLPPPRRKTERRRHRATATSSRPRRLMTSSSSRFFRTSRWSHLSTLPLWPRLRHCPRPQDPHPSGINRMGASSCCRMTRWRPPWCSRKPLNLLPHRRRVQQPREKPLPQRLPRRPGQGTRPRYRRWEGLRSQGLLLRSRSILRPPYWRPHRCWLLRLSRRLDPRQQAHRPRVLRRLSPWAGRDRVPARPQT